MNSFPNRKAARKEARLAKKSKKMTNYLNRKQAKKAEDRSAYLVRNPHIKEEIMKKRNERIPKQKRRHNHHNLPITPNFQVAEDPLLAFAERAIDSGILGSDGEFDEAKMNDLFVEKYSDDSEIDSDDGEVDVISLGDNPDAEKYLNNGDESEEVDILNDDPSDFESDSTTITTIDNTETNTNPKLTRHIHGLINRLTLSNFSPVMCEILNVYNENSKNSVTTSILDSIISSITTQVNLMDNFIITFASLSSVMSHLTGIDMIAQIIERCLSVIDPLRRKDKEERLSSSASSTHNDNDNDNDDDDHQQVLMGNSKIIMNCISLFAYLYNLQIISDTFIISIIRESLKDLNDLDVEIILKLIRLSGYQLRKDESANLKTIIGEVLERVDSIPSTTIQSSRFKFMIETIMDLKNNRQKLVVAASAGGELETSKKVIRSFLQANNLSKLESLRITVDDIRNAPSKGRWWKVGAKWDPEAAGGVSSASVFSNQRSDATDNKIMKAAKAHGMNTDVRRSIFASLMTSDDCKDAFQRLSSLGLKSKQEQEIAHVLLHCSNHERLFNPFYSLTATIFIGSKRSFGITFKYAFWDKVKEMEQMTDFTGSTKEEERLFRSLIQSARFFSVLLARTSTENTSNAAYLPISIMKRCNFAQPSEVSVSFYQVLLCSLLEMVPSDSVLEDVFGELCHPSLPSTKSKRKLQTISQFEGDEGESDEDDFIDIIGDGDRKNDNSGGEDEFSESNILKIEELKTLKIGLRLFMKQFILDRSPTSIPTMKNPHMVHRRIGLLMEGVLSNRN